LYILAVYDNREICNIGRILISGRRRMYS